MARRERDGYTYEVEVFRSDFRVVARHAAPLSRAWRYATLPWPSIPRWKSGKFSKLGFSSS